MIDSSNPLIYPLFMQLSILLFFQRIGNPLLDIIMECFTMLGEIAVPLIVLLILSWCVSRKKAVAVALSLLSALLVSQTLKAIFRVPRPFQVYPDKIRGGRLSTATGYSFPSGHSTTSGAFYSALIMTVWKKWATLIFIIPIILVPVSRMILGVEKTIPDLHIHYRITGNDSFYCAYNTSFHYRHRSCCIRRPHVYSDNHWINVSRILLGKEDCRFNSRRRKYRKEDCKIYNRCHLNPCDSRSDLIDTCTRGFHFICNIFHDWSLVYIYLPSYCCKDQTYGSSTLNIFRITSIAIDSVEETSGSVVIKQGIATES